MRHIARTCRRQLNLTRVDPTLSRRRSRDRLWTIALEGGSQLLNHHQLGGAGSLLSPLGFATTPGRLTPSSRSSTMGMSAVRPLQGGNSDSTLAPAEVRPIFLAVVLECLV